MFLDSLDIANRALQLLGAAQISSPTEDSLNNLEMAFVYDKLKRAELRRNRWVFATKKAVLWPLGDGALRISPPQWSATVTYSPGAIVADANQCWFISVLGQNLNQNPTGNNEAWENYFGTRVATLHNTTTIYPSGSLVYIPGTGVGTGPTFQGGYQVYLALSDVSKGEIAPNVTTPWSATTVYHDGQTVSFSGSQWISLIAYNLNNTPATGPANWSPTTVYTIGQQVTASNQFRYQAAQSSVNVDPVTDGGVNWTPLNVVTAWGATTAVANISWAPVSAALQNFVLVYPVGSGPSQDVTTRNVFPLPAGYLHSVSQAPKAGSFSVLGAPTALNYDDWVLENRFLISKEVGPLTFRFIADVQTVRFMDDLFCEALAARMASATCERITQSTEKVKVATAIYQKAIADARTVNAIEAGPVEPPIDDWISTRI